MKNSQKLQIFLSHNDECSRRAAMDLIKEGMVTVNDQLVTEPSIQIDPQKDKVFINGKRIKQKQYEYIMLNKPSGYVTTKADPHASKTVYQLLPKKYHFLAPVGRLDKDTEGLLILTNDGDVTQKLTHPRYKSDKNYYVKVRNRLEIKERLKIENGVFLDGRKTAKAKIKVIRMKRDFTECLITIREGRKRQVRRMFAAVKHKVTFLKRVSQGPLVLGSLKTGAWRNLNEKEKKQLLQL